MMPGSPQTNMYFTLYGFNTVDQARGLIRDLKMGQYTKLPPRVTFTVQCLGAVIVCCLYIYDNVIFSPLDIGRSAQLHHYESHYQHPS
jgi:hypothetical protein